MKKILLITILASITSCVSVKPSAYRQDNFSPINTTIIKEVGETLILHIEGKYKQALLITKGSKSASPAQSKSINTGDLLVYHHTKGADDFFFKNNDPAVGICVNTKNGNQKFAIFDGLGILTQTLVNKVEFKETDSPDFTQNYIKREFIYNGKSGNTLKFTYREFINEDARPSLTQDMQYDLNESSTIGFQGIRIEVQNATNTAITYKIMKGFN